MKTARKLIATALTTAALTVTASTSFAAECDTVRFSDVGWTDITSTTALTSVVLQGLGYKTTTQMLSVPVTYKSLENGDIDVFLGNWMPTMEGDIRPYLDKGTVETIKTNLTGAKYTLAVPHLSVQMLKAPITRHAHAKWAKTIWQWSTAILRYAVSRDYVWSILPFFLPSRMAT